MLIKILQNSDVWYSNRDEFITAYRIAFPSAFAFFPK